MVSDCTTTGTWTSLAIEILTRLRDEQTSNIRQAAEWCADAIAAGGLVHMFGTGHSRIALEEMFPRYGSFPGFNPIVELSMTFHTQIVGANGQRQAMFIERVPGLAEVVLSNFAFRPTDVMLVFSVSGTSTVSIEIAAGARRRGLRTIAVTSLAHSNGLPLPPGGARLLDVADLAIDLGTPPGDALVAIEGFQTPVGPASTLAAVAVVNEIKVQTAELLLQRGIRPPVITSAALVGSEEAARLSEAAYDEHARRIGWALAAAGEARSPAARRIASSTR